MKSYENYRDSQVKWLGSIPAHWNALRLRRVCDVTLGKMVAPDASSDADTLEEYVCARDVHFDGVNLDNLKKMWFRPNEKGQYRIYDGDLLVVEGGSVGNCAIVKNLRGRPVYVQNSIHIIRPKDDKVIMPYVCYCIQHLCNAGYMKTVSNVATIAHYTKQKVLATIIPVPPRCEQDQIARFLDWKISSIDRLIAIREEELSNLEELKKAVISHAVRRENCDYVKLKYVVTVRREKGTYRDKTDDRYIGLENIRGYSEELIDTETGYDTSTQSVCRKGDLLFGKLRPYLAKVVIAPYDAFCTGELLVISGFAGEMRYLRYVMLMPEFINEVDACTYGVKMPRVSSADILNVIIPVPAIREQKEIADKLDEKCAQIDMAVENFSEQIDTLRELKARLISDTVTGKIDVSNIEIPVK